MKRYHPAHPWHSRSALAASLMLHGLLIGWMASHALEPAAEPQRPGEVWFDAPKSPPPEAKKEEQAKSPLKRPVKVPARKAPGESTQGPLKGASADLRATEPRATDAPRNDSLRLLPLLPSAASSSFTVEPSRGETIQPDDPRFDSDVMAARETQRVKGRVDGWAEDALAEARATRGLPHPYLLALGESARAGLGRRAREGGLRASPAVAARALGDRIQSAAESYGKGGDPNLGPPGQAPRLSEKIAQPDQLPLKALAQAAETLTDLTRNKPLLTLTLEFRQSRGSDATKTTILKASIDPGFDAFVLQAWPLSIAAAGPPPADAFRTSELRSIWEVEGWPGAGPADKVMSYLPEGGLMGVPLTPLIPAAMGSVGYEFRAKLLRVY